LCECDAVRPRDSVTPDADPDDQERSPFPPVVLPFPPVDPATLGPMVWGCPKASCQYGELGRIERAGGDGICPQHDEPLVRVNG
jgi:hypothetical protein